MAAIEQSEVQWYIGRANGQAYGPCTVQDIADRWGHAFIDTDFAWCDGMTDWVPIGQLDTLVEQIACLIPTPPSSSASSMTHSRPVTREREQIDAATLSQPAGKSRTSSSSGTSERGGTATEETPKFSDSAVDVTRADSPAERAAPATQDAEMAALKIQKLSRGRAARKGTKNKLNPKQSDAQRRSQERLDAKNAAENSDLGASALEGKVGEAPTDNPAAREAAALKLQKIQRGKAARVKIEARKKKQHEQRKKAAEEKLEEERQLAARKIQALQRGKNARKQVETIKQDKLTVAGAPILPGSEGLAAIEDPAEDACDLAEMETAALRIQSLSRGCAARKRAKNHFNPKQVEAQQRAQERMEIQMQDRLDNRSFIEKTVDPEGERIKAAMKIQAVQRGKSARAEAAGKRKYKREKAEAEEKLLVEEPRMKQMREEQELKKQKMEAAIKIQAVQRGKIGRRKFLKKQVEKEAPKVNLGAQGVRTEAAQLDRVLSNDHGSFPERWRTGDEKADGRDIADLDGDGVVDAAEREAAARRIQAISRGRAARKRAMKHVNPNQDAARKQAQRKAQERINGRSWVKNAAPGLRLDDHQREEAAQRLQRLQRGRAARVAAQEKQKQQEKQRKSDELEAVRKIQALQRGKIGRRRVQTIEHENKVALARGMGDQSVKEETDDFEKETPRTYLATAYRDFKRTDSPEESVAARTKVFQARERLSLIDRVDASPPAAIVDEDETAVDSPLVTKPVLVQQPAPIVDEDQMPDLTPRSHATLIKSDAALLDQGTREAAAKRLRAAEEVAVSYSRKLAPPAISAQELRHRMDRKQREALTAKQMENKAVAKDRAAKRLEDKKGKNQEKKCAKVVEDVAPPRGQQSPVSQATVGAIPAVFMESDDDGYTPWDESDPSTKQKSPGRPLSKPCSGKKGRTPSSAQQVVDPVVQARAASSIQAQVRGWQIRQQSALYKQQALLREQQRISATKIQATFRGGSERRRMPAGESKPLHHVSDEIAYWIQMWQKRSKAMPAVNAKQRKKLHKTLDLVLAHLQKQQLILVEVADNLIAEVLVNSESNGISALWQLLETHVRETEAALKEASLKVLHSLHPVQRMHALLASAGFGDPAGFPSRCIALGLYAGLFDNLPLTSIWTTTPENAHGVELGKWWLHKIQEELQLSTNQISKVIYIAKQRTKQIHMLTKTLHTLLKELADAANAGANNQFTQLTDKVFEAAWSVRSLKMNRVFVDNQSLSDANKAGTFVVCRGIFGKLGSAPEDSMQKIRSSKLLIAAPDEGRPGSTLDDSRPVSQISQVSAESSLNLDFIGHSGPTPEDENLFEIVALETGSTTTAFDTGSTISQELKQLQMAVTNPADHEDHTDQELLMLMQQRQCGSPMRSGKTNSPLQSLEDNYHGIAKDWQVQRYEDVSLMLHHLGGQLPGASKKCSKRKGKKHGGSLSKMNDPWQPTTAMGADIPSHVEPVKAIHNEQYCGTLEKARAATAPPPDIKMLTKLRRSSAPGAKFQQKMAPLPRVSRLACCPAPTITVSSFRHTCKVVAQFQHSWEEITELITTKLNLDANANIPHVSKLYTIKDLVVTSKQDLVDGMHYYTHPQEQLKVCQEVSGMNRKNTCWAQIDPLWSPAQAPLISPEAHSSLIKSVEKRMQRAYPTRLLVRANRWTENVKPPSCYCKNVLIKGTFQVLLTDITQTLNLDQACKRLYHPDGKAIHAVEDMEDGQTVYLCSINDKVFSKRDWAKTLCPVKSRTVVAHKNFWSDAAPPSRYTQKIVVPSNLILLMEVITLKLKTDQPVLKLWQQNGDRITKLTQIKDNTHIYICPKPETMKLSNRKWGETLSPLKKKTIKVHDNYFDGDPGKVVVITANMINPRWADQVTQWLILMEACTKALGLSILCRTLFSDKGELVLQDTEAIEDGKNYYTLPPPHAPETQDM